jgi:hypothetical protein
MAHGPWSERARRSEQANGKTEAFEQDSDTQSRTEAGRQGRAGAAAESSGAGKNEDSTEETLTSGEETERRSARWKMRTGRRQHLLPAAEGEEKKSFRESFKLAANRDKDGTLPE